MALCRNTIFCKFINLKHYQFRVAYLIYLFSFVLIFSLFLSLKGFILERVSWSNMHWHRNCKIMASQLYNFVLVIFYNHIISSHDIWAASSEFVSSSIPSWQILTAHAQSFREARDVAFWLKVPLDSLLVWASSGGSGETARMRRLAWTFAARIGDKYQIRLTRPIWQT